MKKRLLVHRNLFLGLLVAVLSALSTTQVIAGEVINAKINLITATTEGEGWLVTVDKPVTNAAPCATVTQTSGVFVVPTNTSSGRAMIASLLVAHATQQTVTIYGRGNVSDVPPCNVWPNTETLAYVNILRLLD